MLRSEAEYLRSQLEKAVQSLDDKDGLSIKNMYPSFVSIIGKKVKKGLRFTYNGKLWRVEQPVLTINEQYPPGDGMESLYSEVVVAYTGTVDDPIPYRGNMELEKGKYYVESDIMYKCIRSTGVPVYDKLSTLATVQGGSFVEIVK